MATIQKQYLLNSKKNKNFLIFSPDLSILRILGGAGAAPNGSAPAPATQFEEENIWKLGSKFY